MTKVEKEAISYARVRLSMDDYPLYNDEYELMLAFEAGAEWRQSNLWHLADGDYLPEIDREVIVFTQTERQYPKVAIAHTMPLGDWKQFDGNRYYLERNGEVGWSLPDVVYWLDANFPFKEDEV